MAKDDYFVIAYRILIYLYSCLKSDVKPDTAELSPQRLDVNPEYWAYIIGHLQNDGYIENAYIGKLLGGMPSVKLDNIAITPTGIEFMQEKTRASRTARFCFAVNRGKICVNTVSRY